MAGSKQEGYLREQDLREALLTEGERPARLAPLSPRLRVMMIPLSLITLAVFAWLVPSLYQRAHLHQERAEGRLAATSLASALRVILSSYPQTWPYRYRAIQDESKFILKMGLFVQVSFKGRPGYLISERGVQSLEGDEARVRLSALRPIGSATLSDGAQALGRVMIHEPSGGLEQERELWWLALGLGGMVALLISLIPLRSAHRADQSNEALWAALTALNAQLELRIHERTEQLKQLNTRLMSVQEAERSRISRDLHDELGQTLTAARIQLSTLELLSPLSPAPLAQLHACLGELDRALEQLRSIAYELRPPELDGLGLRAALERHVTRRAERAELTIQIRYELPELSERLNTTIFRLVQEGLTNVIRHAAASEVELSLSIKEAQGEAEGEPKEVLITLKDDGCGPPASLQAGVGLIGLESRAREHQGYVSLSARVGGGSCLEARLALELFGAGPQRA